MNGSFIQFFTVALAAALCSPIGGLVAIALKPSSLLLSIMAGLAGGVLLGAIAFEMLPQALEQSSLFETGSLSSSVWRWSMASTSMSTAAPSPARRRNSGPRSTIFTGAAGPAATR